MPSGQNLCGLDVQARDFNAELSEYFEGNASVPVLKDIFVLYTDASFTTRAPRELHEGLLGPTLRMEVWCLTALCDIRTY